MNSSVIEAGIRARMAADGSPALVIDAFLQSLRRWNAGDLGTIPGADLAPLGQLTRLEELDEFNLAADSDDVPGMFDALIDLVYVALGTAHILNLPWEAGWDQVQRANMAKVRAAKDGSDSKRGSGWDVVKPDGWRAPDLEAVLQSMGWTADK